MVPMAKSGIYWKNTSGLLLASAGTTGWALCIGAGTSVPLFPSWPALVEKLLTPYLGTEAPAKCQQLLRMYSPDALIQAAANLATDQQAFQSFLSTCLYADLSAKVDGETWQNIAWLLGRPGKKAVTKTVWKQFLFTFRKALPRTTAVDLAEVLVDVLGTAIEPAAILSFNAESLLFTLLNAVSWERATSGGKGSPTKGDDRECLDLVTRSISGRRPDRVPYILCHGMLPIPTAKAIKSMAALDKLVFSESEYLELANQSFSWQSSAFLDICASRTVVFVGVSLSDPNMRRWLTWTHANRLREIQILEKRAVGVSTLHYWINKRPREVELARIIESTVQHLGVRLIWIDEWNEVGDALRLMLSAECPIVPRPHRGRVGGKSA
jgi:hypothetical protein